MDQYTPNDSDQQQGVPPSGPQTPPPHQPYQPPVQQQPPMQGYQQPQGQQSPSYQQPGYQQPGQQPSGQTYYPPPPPPEQKRKGFNWLACCGITCGVLLIITIILIAIFAKSCMGLIKEFESFESTAADVNNTPIEQIRVEATIVDSNVLVQNPESYKDQWIAVEGLLEGDVPAGSSFEMGEYGSHNTTTYMLEGPVIVMDLSNSPRIGQDGDRIRAYGKVIVFDMTSIPVFGSMVEEMSKQDPSMQDVPMKSVLFYTRDIEVIEPLEGDPEEEGNGTEPPWEQRQW